MQPVRTPALRQSISLAVSASDASAHCNNSFPAWTSPLRNAGPIRVRQFACPLQAAPPGPAGGSGPATQRPPISPPGGLFHARPIPAVTSVHRSTLAELRGEHLADSVEEVNGWLQAERAGVGPNRQPNRRLARNAVRLVIGDAGKSRDCGASKT